MLQRFCHYAAWVGLILNAPLHAAALNDTGVRSCYDDTAADTVPVSDPASIAAPGGSHPRQDCRYGRDAASRAGALSKIGGGAAGFDFTKIANDGSTLPAGAVLGPNPTDWGCTQDNTTGLMWEVKVDDDTHRRHWDWYYTWYNSDGASNGGDAGLRDTAEGIGSDRCLGGVSCDTESYAAEVNTAVLCGFSDWRLPSARELRTLVHFGNQNPSIDSSYFPNTNTLFPLYWTISTHVLNVSSAWYVKFGEGRALVARKQATYLPVRLVRGGAF